MPLAVVRGGGDLATGVIYRLWRTGFRLLVLETARPMVIRRPVSAAQAMFDGSHVVDGMEVRRIASVRELPDDGAVGGHGGPRGGCRGGGSAPVGRDDEVLAARPAGAVGVVADPRADCLEVLRPDLLVDAIMAKRNCGTRRGMAPRVVGLGPGFRAPRDVHAVVETLRGHDLGRVILKGEAAPDTGVPGEIGGATTDRLVRSPGDGFLEPRSEIGDLVEAGQALGFVGGKPVVARIGGVLRGLIHPTVPVKEGMKIGDVDPRAVRYHCFSISDKALSVGGGVLEAAFAVELD